MENSGKEEAFAAIFALRLLVRHSLPVAEYQPPKALETAISIAETARPILAKIVEDFPDDSLANIYYAFFLKMFHHELLIDIDGTDFQTLKLVLDSEIKGKQRRYPWVYGLTLYDRFFDKFPFQTDSLTASESDELLKDAEIGVFQIRNLLIGPFGLLELSHMRDFPPILDPALWHCSDPVCNSLHSVRLEKHKLPVDRILGALTKYCNETEGKASEWPKYFSFELSGRPEYYDHLNTGQLLWLVGNAFSKHEMTQIAEDIIQRHRDVIQSVLPDTNRVRNLMQGSAKQVAKRLSDAERMQLICIVPDREIVLSIEELIDTNAIVIPPTEIRSPVISTRPRSWLLTRAECSRFGVRFVPTHPAAALLRLRMLLKLVHDDPSISRTLTFKLRKIPGESVGEQLDCLLSTESPRAVVQDYLFQSEEHLERAFDFLKFGSFKSEAMNSDEGRLISKILWKLGFDVRDFPTYQTRFWDYHQRLASTARTYVPYDENDRDAIRSVAANFWVSMEEVFDFSLSFITWALLSDHFAETQFVCSFDEARKLMVSHLGNRTMINGEPLLLDESGKNSLFPLIEGFSVLANLCEEILENSKQSRRPEQQIPEFAEVDGLFEFPFRHVHLLLDLAKPDQRRLIDHLRSITRTLNDANVGDVRNRIAHKRLIFPNQDEIEKALDGISKVVHAMETSGVCPIIYRMVDLTKDSYARERTTLVNYKSRVVHITEPSRYDPCRLPDSSWPLIIVPWARIGDSVEVARFRFKEDSAYSSMWSAFPKRRVRLPVETPDEIGEDVLSIDA